MEHLKNSDKLLVKRRGTSFNGILHSLAISALQKYIRRAEVDKATYIAVDLDLNSLINNAEFRVAYEGKNPTIKHASSQSKAIRTQMVNRLKIIVSEDIGIGALNSPSTVDRLLKKWDGTRSLPYPDDKVGRDALVSTVRYLSEVKHLRLISYIKTMFDLPPYYHYYADNKKGVKRELYDKSREFICKKYAEQIVPDQSVSADKYLDEFDRLLKLADIKCFYWLGKAMRNGLNESKLRDHIKILLTGTISSAVRKEVDVLLRWHSAKRGRESILHLYHVLLLLLYQNDSRLVSKDLVEVDSDKYYLNNLANEKISLDNYVKDRHTGAKGADRSLTFFARQGAHVENKSRFYEKIMDDIYVDMKVLLDGGEVSDKRPRPKPNVIRTRVRPTRIIRIANKKSASSSAASHSSSLISNAQIKAVIADGYMTQKRTGRSKKKTFLSDNIVVKGPYLESDSSYKNFIHFSERFKQLEKILELPAKLVTRIESKRTYEDRDGNLWLVFMNIGNFYPKFFVEVDTKLDGKVKVLKSDDSRARGNAEILEMIYKLPESKITPEIRQAVLQHMYIRTILGIGDSGTHNMAMIKRNPLVKGQILAGYDYEEKRAFKEFDTALDTIFQKKASTKRALLAYQPYLKDIVKFTAGNMKMLTESEQAIAKILNKRI